MLTATALATLALASPAPAPAPRAVGLLDAHSAPTYLRYLQPGHATTVRHQCPRGGYWSDISAYQWNGRALRAQRWNADHDRLVWGRVSFDGITFRNSFTRSPVLVAGWCE